MNEKQESKLVKNHEELVDALADFFSYMMDTPELAKHMLGTESFEGLASAYAHATCQDSAFFMGHIYEECAKAGGIPGKEA